MSNHDQDQLAQPAFATPLEVSAVDNEVVILGPDGLCGSLTPEAAELSALRLLAAARAAARDAADGDPEGPAPDTSSNDNQTG